MIPCALYDYIEIACLFHYPVTLTLRSGEQLCGQAMDTVRDAAGRECLKLAQAEGEQLVVLDQLARLQVTVDNPHFRDVNFS
ncbi:Rho-binding antiterminator [Ferrimonas balearica]|uniref:Rho-binding antiterminator n=1 Tax=Ferrimonas balearica TaxID=44012 RepID=UPI001C99288E|nr:Rho-binding antiterminator [Ferrimonas balearica]MBY5993229.1 Rho-binding antiterminator [Ferrimonas balearica]